MFSRTLAAALTLCAFAAAQENSVSNQLGAAAYEAGMSMLKIVQDPATASSVDAAGMYKLAAEAFATGVDQGHTDCANELGKLYLQGMGVAWDPVKARDLFQQSAEGGNMRGMTNLGMMYRGYRGIPQDYAKAAEWLTKAAELGQPMAQYELAEVYSYGSGVERDEEKALEWYNKSAEQGFPKAQFKLGFYHAYGHAGATEDTALAIAWLQKAAKSNDPEVVADVASQLLLEDGPIYDPGAAALILPEAAKAGNWNAQYLLGKLYHDGYGVKQDFDIAFRLLNASAGQGRPEALALVAGMYLRGEGTEKNPQAAYVCAEMADDSGWPFFDFRLEEAIKLMTPEQLEQAKAVVAERKAANAQRRAEQEKLNPKPQGSN